VAHEINWLRIGSAVEWYKALDFTYIEAPWLVNDGPYDATRPPDAPYVTAMGKNLVASGEQSFIQMMSDGHIIGKAVCCTPCFRDEPSPDGLHHPYFVKVELIWNGGDKHQLYEVVNEAFNFFSNGLQAPPGQFLMPDVVDMGDGSYDIVDTDTGVELGSYGIRKWKDFSWVYGTGLAEPRVSQVLARKCLTTRPI